MQWKPSSLSRPLLVPVLRRGPTRTCLRSIAEPQSSSSKAVVPHFWTGHSIKHPTMCVWGRGATWKQWYSGILPNSSSWGYFCFSGWNVNISCSYCLISVTAVWDLDPRMQAGHEEIPHVHLFNKKMPGQQTNVQTRGWASEGGAQNHEDELSKPDVVWKHT